MTVDYLNHLPQLRCVLLLREEEKRSYSNSNFGKQNKFCEAKFPPGLSGGEPRLQRWGGVNIVSESKSVIGIEARNLLKFTSTL